jgi:hypothetical protein
LERGFVMNAYRLRRHLPTLRLVAKTSRVNKELGPLELLPTGNLN